ncbi:MAG: imidazole glycerol phosphate synthase subunit HisH [Planctomycetota bacterium]
MSTNEKVCIVDYGAGNLTSVRLAVEALGWEAQVTGRPETVRSAQRVIFPGVGAAGAAMDRLQSSGLDEAIADYAGTGRPMAGICLGAQIIFDHSTENDTECLGLVPGSVKPLPVGQGFKVPHMGWNGVDFTGKHPVWEDVPSGVQFYFVHAYAAVPREEEPVIGKTEYDVPFVSAIGQENLVAFQFHPERSGRFGLQVLDNFLKWRP